MLGQMLFRGEEGLKKTEALSGGETARLIFCKLMLQKPNMLMLDEPTNHLDLEAINALNIALQRTRAPSCSSPMTRTSSKKSAPASGTSIRA